MTVMQSMKLGIDVNRHKEIIVKAVSAILLLLLKHFKVLLDIIMAISSRKLCEMVPLYFPGQPCVSI